MVQRYAHLEPVTLKEAIRTLEPKIRLDLDFGHNMATISEKVKTKEKILGTNLCKTPINKAKNRLSSVFILGGRTRIRT